MSRRRRNLLLLLLVIVAGLVVLGSVRGNRIDAEVGERHLVAISANVLSFVEVVISEGTAKVTIGELRATLTPERVELADGSTIAVPARCAEVEMREEDGRIRVRLDGAEAH